MTANQALRQCVSVVSMLVLVSGMACAADLDSTDDGQRLSQSCTGVATDDCIIRQFKDSPEASLIRGKVVFNTYCVLCHGVTGEGNGRAAKIHNPKPANFTKSILSLDYFRQIVPKGGEAMGRSKAMPPWSEQLTQEQINDVTFYAFSLRNKKPEGEADKQP